MLQNHPATLSTVAIVNNTKIVVIENGEKRVAIKPICEALGISHKPQIERLNHDPNLSSVVMLSVTTGSDGKQYEMVTIPFKYVFGWLFRIDSRNVRASARESVVKYQLECYDALYRHFTELDEYMQYRASLTEQVWDEVEKARDDFKAAKSKLDGLKQQFSEARSLTLESWRAQKRQLSIEFEEETQ